MIFYAIILIFSVASFIANTFGGNKSYGDGFMSALSLGIVVLYTAVICGVAT